MVSTVVAGPVAVAGLLDPLQRSIAEPPRSMARPILAATDGSDRATAALRIATALARRDDEALEVITIEEKLPQRVRGFCLDAVALLGESGQGVGVLATIRQQLRAVLGDSGWRLHVEFGDAARSIARAAAEQGARLVVVGIGRATAAERIFGGETANRILRHASVPVLAVHPETIDLPHRVVAAMDFSDPSLRAVRAAATLVEPPGVIHLINVSAREDDQLEEMLGWRKVYRAGMESMCARLELELARPGVTVKSHFLTGLVTKELAAFARREGADLICAGTHSHQIVDRLLLGSVPAQLLRAAECSVLVAPPA